MTMTYDGTMVMPKNYAVVTEDEMTYVDGGDAANFANNIYGILERFVIGYGNRTAMGIPGMLTIAKMGYAAACLKFVALPTKLAAFTGNPVVIGIAVLGGVAAVTYLWNVRVFY